MPKVSLESCLYWGNRYVSLYHCDCRSYPELFKQANLFLTDPPYGISHPCSYKKRGRSNLAQCKDYPDVIGDDKPFDPAFLLQSGLPAILWGGNYYADKLPPTSGWLVWDKERPDTLDQATCELAWSNCIKGVRRFRHLWNGFIRASERGQAYHPTQKPVALMEWCLSLKWVQSLSVVIDPFMGSGSTGVACVKQQKRFIGVELSLDYLKIAKQRIQQALLENRQQGKHHA